VAPTGPAPLTPREVAALLPPVCAEDWLCPEDEPLPGHTDVGAGLLALAAQRVEAARDARVWVTEGVPAQQRRAIREGAVHLGGYPAWRDEAAWLRTWHERRWTR